jgi:hypothetical protein
MSANANALNNSKNDVSSWFSSFFGTKAKPAAVVAPVAKPNNAPVAKPNNAPVAKPNNAPVAKPNNAPVATANKPNDAPAANANKVPLAIGGSKKNYHRRGRTERRNRTRSKKNRS